MKLAAAALLLCTKAQGVSYSYLLSDDNNQPITKGKYKDIMTDIHSRMTQILKGSEPSPDIYKNLTSDLKKQYKDVKFTPVARDYFNLAAISRLLFDKNQYKPEGQGVSKSIYSLEKYLYSFYGYAPKDQAESLKQGFDKIRTRNVLGKDFVAFMKDINDDLVVDRSIPNMLKSLAKTMNDLEEQKKVERV